MSKRVGRGNRAAFLTRQDIPREGVKSSSSTRFFLQFLPNFLIVFYYISSFFFQRKVTRVMCTLFCPLLHWREINFQLFGMMKFITLRGHFPSSSSSLSSLSSLLYIWYFPSIFHHQQHQNHNDHNDNRLQLSLQLLQNHYWIYDRKIEYNQDNHRNNFSFSLPSWYDYDDYYYYSEWSLYFSVDCNC